MRALPVLKLGQATGSTDMHQRRMRSSVATSRRIYTDSDDALITVTAADSQGPVEGAAVRIHVASPHGHDLVGAASTDGGGEASMRLAIDMQRDGTGTYAVGATASKDGFEPADSTATFEVRGEVA